MIAPSDAITGPVIDLAYLESSSFGQRDFVLGAIDILIEQLPEQVEELNEAVTAQDWELLTRCAHKVKSAVALLGMKPAEQTLHHIETSAFAQDEMDLVAQSVGRVIAACTLACEELKAERYKYL